MTDAERSPRCGHPMASEIAHMPCILRPGHAGSHASMDDVEWALICPQCGASASLPMGMTCDDHHPVVVAIEAIDEEGD